MLQVRKLVLAVAAVTAFTSSYAHALGLGDIAVKSSLNQPLEAEISLLEVRDLTSAEVKTRLASPEEFSKAGVDRQFFLTGLTFTPVISSTGKNVIRVSSKQPVKEPYLNFLVEVIWPNGRLLREYTLLLDPPLYAPQQVIYAPKLAATPAGAVRQPDTRRQTPPVRSRTTAKTTHVPHATQGGEYRVQKNDTLWEIASRIKGNGTVHQAMLAIQDLNPNAFVDGNINRMKSGQVLRLPDAEAINKRTYKQALAQVTQQNESWKAGTSTALAERQMDATRRVEAGAAPAAIEKQDSLRLVSDAAGQAQQAADQGADAEIRALQDKLARSEEFLDSTILEKEELQSRVEDLSSQLEKLQRLIELKDNQLAQLQNADDTLVQLPIEDTEITAEVGDEADISEDFENIASLAGDAETEQLEGLESIEATQLDSAENGVSEVAETLAAKPETVEPEPEPEPVVEQPVAVTPETDSVATQEKTLLEKILDNPTLLAATGGSAVIALLLLLMGLSRSRARKEAEQQVAEIAEEPKPTAPAGLAAEAGLDVSPDTSALDDTTLEQQTDDPLAGFDAAEPVLETQIKEEAADPLAEAAGYIGFGRLNQAADVLNKALEAEPARVDLRCKLLEVYADLDDQVGFAKQVNELTEMGGADEQLAQFKTRYPKMFATDQVLAPVLDNELAELDLELDLEDSKLDGSTEALTDISKLDAELDELSAFLDETALEAQAPSTSSELDALSLDGFDDLAEQVSKEPALDLDFDLDLDLAETEQSATDASPAEASLDDLGDLDLDSLELDLAAMGQTESDTKQVATDEFSLDELSRDLEEAIQSEQPDSNLDEAFSFEAFESDTQKQDLADFDLTLDELNLEQDTLSAAQLDENIQLDTELDSSLEGSAAPVEADPQADLTDLSVSDLDSIDDDFSFLSGTDETATKLDLARAYIDMGDAEGARDILDEVVAEGTAAQQAEARELAKQLG